MTKTPEQIHDNMSKVRSKDTGIEKMLRKELWSRGLRYQKNSKKVFGKPDIVFIGRKVAVFCDSEFWHGYDWERSKENLKTNKEFWTQKIENNMDRDREVTDALEKDGWIVLRFWGKEIKADTSGCADIVEKAVREGITKYRMADLFATSPRRYSRSTGITEYRMADLFAGIGGIRKGFETAFGKKVKTVFVSELDKYAQQTYRANFDTPAEINGDITAISAEEILGFDICLAGFPCQAFSTAGNKNGFSDDYRGVCRGTLFLDVARVCDAHRPKVIFCENVKGLVTIDRGKTLSIILDVFKSLGYTVYHDVLNSKNYGVPQNRERLYIVAFREDIDSTGFSFPAPTETGTTLKEILETDPVSVKYYLSTSYLETLKKHKAHHKARGNGFGYLIKKESDIASAIMCGGMGRERNLLVDDRITDYRPITRIKGEVNRENIRRMTPREWAKLQGFDDIVFPVSEVHQYRQLGNSVTVPVIAAIASEIKKVLDGQKG